MKRVQVWRGIWGRQRAAHFRAVRAHRAAQWIQSVARGKRDRERVKAIRFHNMIAHEERVLRASLTLQRVTRGLFGRIIARPIWQRRCVEVVLWVSSVVPCFRWRAVPA